jgi:hypothetical protein
MTKLNLTTRVALMVTVINSLTRIYIVRFVSYLSLSTRSKEIKFAIMAMFLSNLFNVVLMLVVTDTTMFKMFLVNKVSSA